MWRRVSVPKKPASSTSVMKPSAARAWNAGQRRERGDVVRLGMEPADRIGLHHVMEDEAALVGRQPEGARELGIMGRTTRLDEPSHDALEHPVHEARLGHPTGL